jgi:ABC-type dipeptide/oligopeptide/nickel transport system permease component
MLARQRSNRKNYGRVPQNITTSYRPTVRIALLPAVLSVACGAAATWLAAHYPLSPTVATFLVLACIALSVVQPLLFLALPALLPVIGLAPWTGWITFDLLVWQSPAGARPTELALFWHRFWQAFSRYLACLPWPGVFPMPVVSSLAGSRGITSR